MRWVALLRAVNLGARNKVPMAELRALLEDAGYGNVRTYIASGNVLLDGPRSRAQAAGELERLVANAFDVETTAILRAHPRRCQQRWMPGGHARPKVGGISTPSSDKMAP